MKVTSKFPLDIKAVSNQDLRLVSYRFYRGVNKFLTDIWLIMNRSFIQIIIHRKGCQVLELVETVARTKNSKEGAEVIGPLRVTIP